MSATETLEPLSEAQLRSLITYWSAPESSRMHRIAAAYAEKIINGQVKMFEELPHMDALAPELDFTASASTFHDAKAFLHTQGLVTMELRRFVVCWEGAAR